MIYSYQNMSQKDLVNPFLSSRSVTSESSSLLSYGDDKYSVYTLLKGNNSRLYRSQVVGSEKAMEEKILRKYEKKYYETDSLGHSMAEMDFQEKVDRVNSDKDDFWSNLQPLRSSKQSNPFSSRTSKDDLDTASNFTTSSFSKMANSRSTFQTGKSDRKIQREQALKLKFRIQTKKQLQGTIPVELQKFSLMKMYKRKQPDQGYGLTTTVTFGQLESRRDKDQLKFQYPQSIFVGEQQYFFVPLG